jgi:hypothetical protein
MVKDFEGHSHWYDLTQSQYLQGLLAQIYNEQRVYVVTIEPLQRDGDIVHVIASRVDDYSPLLGRLRTESRDFR